jgi:hypothetical protein
MNIQLTEVLTDVMGMTGQAIIRDIVAGQRDPKVLARHRHSRVKASAQEITKALTGNWREEHLFVLAHALAMYDSVAQRVLECDCKIEALLAPLASHEVKLDGPAKRAGKNTPIRPAHSAGALGRRGPHAYQRTGGDLGTDGAVRNRPGLEPL